MTWIERINWALLGWNLILCGGLLWLVALTRALREERDALHEKCEALGHHHREYVAFVGEALLRIDHASREMTGEAVRRVDKGRVS